nr:MAG TPA: hypothetical protein [Caudoviricetes sp.]
MRSITHNKSVYKLQISSVSSCLSLVIRFNLGKKNPHIMWGKTGMVR